MKQILETLARQVIKLAATELEKGVTITVQGKTLFIRLQDAYEVEAKEVK